jgi:hypothetical protein
MVMSIREVIDYCKSDKVFMASLIILVGVGSFGLGRLSVSTTRKSPVTVVNVAPEVSHKLFLVGSRSSKKYYFPWCAVALRLNESNKITFMSEQEARLAGYSVANNCTGLE